MIRSMQFAICQVFRNIQFLTSYCFLGALLAFTAGCGRPEPYTGDPTKKITWEEFEKMDAEEQDDPYVVDNLDDDAKKKLGQRRSNKR